MIVRVCVGSSCHLRGSSKVLELLNKAVEQHHLENDVTLMGSFCIGKCSTIGATVQVDDEIHVDITEESFDAFFTEHILNVQRGE